MKFEQPMPKQEQEEEKKQEVSQASEKSQAMEETKTQSVKFEKYDALNPEQKKYVDMVNELRETEVEKQKQYNEDRGFVYIGNEKINIDEFAKNPDNLDKLDFTLVSNIQNMDLLVGKISPEKMYQKLEALGSNEKMIEKLDSMPLEAKKKFINSLPSGYRQNLSEKYQEAIHKNISNPDASISFMYALRSVNLPLEKHEKSKGDYVKEVVDSKNKFLENYQKEMEKYGPFAVSKVFEGSTLKELFRATESKYLPREKVIEMTRDVIRKYGEMKRSDMQPKIIESVLALKREGVINEEEANKILSLG